MAVDLNSAGLDIIMKPNSITTTTAIQGRDSSQLSMDDFFNLLVAQLTNQDMMNPQNDTEFIAQMAQFSALKGVQTIQEYQLSSYAVSYTGKNVAIAVVDDASGDLKTIEGVVESVTFYDGKPKVIVNGTAYDLHTVMEVRDAKSAGNVSLNEAAAYIGKTVKVGYEDENGNPVVKTGAVTSVTLRNKVPCVMIGDEVYPAKDIISVED